ncbi:hypothetical protein [Acinetobacter baumannii]|uniref:hypothetical protein n=1 Tax=Acinetobacter baumannii TaxID=470 RepID=UPI00034C3D4E|nr:hypothetical protein [Acinetobacter baumannii]MCA4328072.1 hypothetical protein [Acinetobacter baumannii]MCG6627766.1 hypothetical protein [Acinetobacter baumannii]MCG6634722.1 hypothetical protein [Acinetobacter baumannii]MCT9548747.1 hypothetical protein [Acinetobacter baumannii]MDM8460652.1 hypothetical protein [Acinetobacter baumannii]
MKTVEQFSNDVLQHSFLIIWSEEKQQWQVECPLLKIRFDAETYKEALAEIFKAILNSDISSEFYETIEKHKTDYLTSDD